MASDYKDTWISAGDDGIAIRFYYFPIGTKHISYADVQGITRVNMGLLSGRGRMWGSGNPGQYWASLDPMRPRKKVAYILDLGHRIKPYVTPADPEGFEAALAAHTSVPVEDGGRGGFM